MLKIRRLVKATIIATVALFPSTVFAQIEPDSRGDYYSSAANWIVVSSGRLNCRSGPGTGYRILTTYSRASNLPTFSELEGDSIRRDRQGRPWVRIKWAGTGSPPCYVRANTSFIHSMDMFTLDEAACVERGVKRGLSFSAAAYDCEP